MKTYKDVFEKVINLENLFSAWEEFKHGKGSRPDVELFERDLEPNVFGLNGDLKCGNYKHGLYTGFFIADPKRRHVHKAIVRDRVLHHAVFSILNPIFEPTFIAASFSCRIGKGSHRGVEAVAGMLKKVSRNNSRPCYVLKCDIRKFFDTINHHILLSRLSRKIRDVKMMSLLRELIESYSSEAEFMRERERERESCGASRQKGIPIGNLTSQLFANVYMNEFDQFVKHILKVTYYARYTDDFIIVSTDRMYLNNLLAPIQDFFGNTLRLELHPHKMTVRKYSQGIDFLGYVILPHCRLVRKRSWKRMLRKFRVKVSGYRQGKITAESLEQSLHSYAGALSHADAYDLLELLENQRLL